MKYSEQDIRNSVKATDFIKGKEYFRYGYVTECTPKTDNDALLIFSSKSRGSYENIYIQNVQIYRTFGTLKFHGTCTCPVGFNCKHVIAAYLYYLHSPKKLDPKAQLDQWVANIKRSVLLSEQETKIAQDNFLIYRIYRYDSPYDQGDVKFYKTKCGKSGKINKGTHIAEQNLLFGMNHHELLSDEDWVIFGLCRKRYDRYSNSIQLKESSGYVLLKKLIESGRCYLSDSDTPLHLNDSLFSMKFEWIAEDLEYSRLISNLTSEQLLTRTVPPMLLNAQENSVQTVENAPDSKMLDLLLKAPPLKNEHLIDAYESLHTLVAIPAPQGYSTQTLKCPPVPRIALKKNSETNQHVIYMTMMYEHFRFECAATSDREYVTKNGMRIEVIRDKDTEFQSILTLNNFGFIRQGVGKKLYFFTETSQVPQAALQVWNDFLTHHLKTLKESGWIIDIEDDFVLTFEEAESISVQSEERNDWFSLSFNVEFGGVARPLVPLLTSIIREFDDYNTLPPKLNLQIEENRYITIDTSEMEPVLKTIFELFEKADDTGNITLGAYESHLLHDLNEHIEWKGSRELLELSEKLNDFRVIQRVSPPVAFDGVLREYQQEGLDWLGFLYEFRFCGILADDMGLGKTIQTLVHLSRLKEEEKLHAPSLIVMPTSLIANWRNEAERFTPNLRVLVLHGSERSDSYVMMDEYDLVLTTYPLIARDLEVLEEKIFEYIILDEAQKIKNPKTQMAQAIKTLKSNHRLALSGTPIENHIGELWSIFSFLMPGFLGSLSFFKEAYQNPIEKERDFPTQERLNRRIKPFILRRTKESVALELPPKTEIIKYTQFESKQAKLYETIRSTMEEKVREAIQSKGLGQSHIMILDALLKLRQVCCDPSLLSIDEAKKVKESAKLELLMDLLEELLSEGRKILIFSQFTSMLSIIETKLNAKKIRYVKLTGQTKKREEVITQFTNGEAEIFLISLKAGGVGLNLTQADTVIHYDPWWNPAVENQASDRVYRIGQTKAVFVYKLIVENSIEQKILELQKKKQLIQNTIYEGENSDESTLFKGEELLELLMT